MARPTPPPINIVKPTFVLRVCIGGGAAAGWRFDRNGRHFHYCPNCGIRLWIYHPKSMAGLSIVHALLVRSGIQKFRQSVAMSEMRRSIRAPLSV
jgi:hypothetical protein